MQKPDRRVSTLKIEEMNLPETFIPMNLHGFTSKHPAVFTSVITSNLTQYFTEK
jgi:hypothetical protein